MENKKLYRNTQDKAIAGVCSGFAEYLNMDVATVRVLTVLIVLFTGIGIIPYIILAIVLPAKPEVVVSEESPRYNDNHNNENKQDDDLYEYDEDDYKI